MQLSIFSMFVDVFCFSWPPKKCKILIPRNISCCIHVASPKTSHPPQRLRWGSGQGHWEAQDAPVEKQQTSIFVLERKIGWLLCGVWIRKFVILDRSKEEKCFLKFYFCKIQRFTFSLGKINVRKIFGFNRLKAKSKHYKYHLFLFTFILPKKSIQSLAKAFPAVDFGKFPQFFNQDVLFLQDFNASPPQEIRPWSLHDPLTKPTISWGKRGGGGLSLDSKLIRIRILLALLAQIKVFLKCLNLKIKLAVFFWKRVMFWSNVSQASI